MGKLRTFPLSPTMQMTACYELKRMLETINQTNRAKVEKRIITYKGVNKVLCTMKK